MSDKTSCECLCNMRFTVDFSILCKETLQHFYRSSTREDMQSRQLFSLSHFSVMAKWLNVSLHS